MLRLPPGVPQHTPHTSPGTARSAATAEAAASASCKLLINCNFCSVVLCCRYLCHRDPRGTDYCYMCCDDFFILTLLVDPAVVCFIIAARTAVSQAAVVLIHSFLFALCSISLLPSARPSPPFCSEPLCCLGLLMTMSDNEKATLPDDEEAPQGSGRQPSRAQDLRAAPTPRQRLPSSTWGAMSAMAGGTRATPPRPQRDDVQVHQHILQLHTRKCNTFGKLRTELHTADSQCTCAVLSASSGAYILKPVPVTA